MGETEESEEKMEEYSKRNDMRHSRKVESVWDPSSSVKWWAMGIYTCVEWGDTTILKKAVVLNGKLSNSYFI